MRIPMTPALQIGVSAGAIALGTAAGYTMGQTRTDGAERSKHELRNNMFTGAVALSAVSLLSMVKFSPSYLTLFAAGAGALAGAAYTLADHAGAASAQHALR